MHLGSQEEFELMKKQLFTLSYPWDETWDKNGYKPEVTFELGMNEDGFTMNITVLEANPKGKRRSICNLYMRTVV